MTQEILQSAEFFNTQVKESFAHRRAEFPDVSGLMDAVEYSLFNGGKRFRPMLCYAVAQSLGIELKRITPFAIAVECVHTYSLIHDDLPCMDDDHERRGQPTNHIKFGEDMALLAGDSLLTEAFNIVASSYATECSALIKILSESSGMGGMIRGQVLDLGKGKKTESLSDLIHLHELKTGRLIALCFEGPAILAGRPTSELKRLGLDIGLAFQVKDDLLDVADGDLASFVSFLGVQGTQDYLQALTEKINGKIKELDLTHPMLNDLVSFNLKREL